MCSGSGRGRCSDTDVAVLALLKGVAGEMRAAVRAGSRAGGRSGVKAGAGVAVAVSRCWRAWWRSGVGGAGDVAVAVQKGVVVLESDSVAVWEDVAGGAKRCSGSCLRWKC